MTESLKLPVGIESFEEIRSDGYYYVDKTKLIEQLVDSRGKVNLFTRPRRFGKTLNMSMLKSFFEIGEQEKLDIIEHEYNIPTSQEFREDVRIMCNLSTGIEERATEKTSEKFILNMYKKGYTLDQIADVAETGVDEVEAIIKKKEPAMA